MLGVEKKERLCTIGAATMENNMEASQETKIELPFDPAMSFLIYNQRK